MIIFCHTDTDNLEKILGKKRFDFPDHTWGILGEDYAAFEKLLLLLGNEKRDKEIGPLFHVISRTLRAPMLEFMGELSKANHSIEWWCTGLASKSIFQQDLFKLVCYIKLFQELEKEEVNLILYVADFEFFMILRNMFGQRYIFFTDRSILYARIKNHINLFIKKYVYLAKLLINKLLLIGQNRQALDMETLVFSWVTDKSFTPDLHYQDLWGGIFFDEFTKFSKCRRFASSFIDLKALNKSFLSSTNFIYTSDYCSWLDIFSLPMKRLKLKKDTEVVFQGVDLRPLINLEIKKNNAGLIFPYYIFYKGFINIINSSQKLKIIFHPFEGQPWEKIIKLAIKASASDIKTFGFQHSAFSELQLSNFCSIEEYGLDTMPDYILANSDYNRLKLSKDGFPAERVLTIGDLRFGYLNKKRQQINVATNIDSKTILICLSVKLDEALMILQECCVALKNLKRKDYQFKAIIKPHPLRPFDMRKLSFIGELEKYMEYYDGDIKPVLDKSDILIYINGAVGCEALQLGIPVIQKITDLSIDLDPLNPQEKKSLLYPCFFNELDSALEILLSDNSQKKRQKNLKMKTPSFFDAIQYHNFEKILHLAQIEIS